MSGAASRGLITRQPAMPFAPSRVQLSARSKYARNVMRGAARSPKATRPANLFSITIAPPCSRARSITPTDNSATRFTTGAHSCRARCTRTASRVATAMIPIAESCAPKATASALPVTCQASTIRRHTTTTSPPAPGPRACPVTCQPRPIWSSIRAAITACACPGRIYPRSWVRQTPVTTVTPIATRAGRQRK